MPFVEAVTKVFEGRASIEDAANVLREAERRHGVYILAVGQCGVFDWMHVPRSGAPTITLQQAFGLLNNAEAFDAHFELNDTREGEWCERVFFPFLDDTWLFVDGGFFSTFCGILTSEPVAITHSYRSWGHTLADWANSRNIPRPSGARDAERLQWEYIDFYMTDYLEPLLEDGTRWLSTVCEVLSFNSKRLEAELSPRR
ncbi:hypothetical protein [Myxococcus virescens]|uniref:hypothetical protein n=1 Tax=Myxococcus virescens TaxID=83456 RepID=UPI00115F8823|nr:hypothetical protein [Myxococcus virescens]